MKRQAWLLVTLVTASLIASQAQSPPPAAASAEADWLYYGGDPGGTKYSSLATSISATCSGCRSRGQWKHWDTPPAPGFFESTPLMIDGALYVTTPYNNVAAVDADTGQERWRFDGKAEELGPLLSASGWKLRGTAFWRDGGRLRMFLNSRPSTVLDRCADRKAGSILRQQRRRLAERGIAAHIGPHARGRKARHRSSIATS
jgi:hypothetical protein